MKWRQTVPPHYSGMEEESEELEKEDKEQRDHTYVETVVSRTVSYQRRTTLESSSRMKNGHRKAHTRWGPSVEDKNVSDGIPTESTITSSHTPMNLEDLEKEAKDLDEELEKMIMKGGKHRVDLDAIEERSEKRKKIREAITQARRQTQKEEDRYRESKKSNEKQSLIPYKPEKKEEYTVIVRNLR